MEVFSIWDFPTYSTVQHSSFTGEQKLFAHPVYSCKTRLNSIKVNRASIRYIAESLSHTCLIVHLTIKISSKLNLSYGRRSPIRLSLLTLNMQNLGRSRVYKMWQYFYLSTFPFYCINVFFFKSVKITFSKLTLAEFQYEFTSFNWTDFRQRREGLSFKWGVKNSQVQILWLGNIFAMKETEFSINILISRSET